MRRVLAILDGRQQRIKRLIILQWTSISAMVSITRSSLAQIHSYPLRFLLMKRKICVRTPFGYSLGAVFFPQCASIIDCFASMIYESYAVKSTLITPPEHHINTVAGKALGKNWQRRILRAV